MPMAMGAVQVENYTSTFQMQVVKSTIVFIPVACDHFILISYRPETRGIPQKITLRDEIFRGRSPRNISSRRVIFCGIPRVKGL